MGCNQSTPEMEHQRYRDNLKGIGQTERQMSKHMRALESDNKLSKGLHASRHKTLTGGKGESEDRQQQQLPRLDENGHLLPEEVAKRTFSCISNHEATLGSNNNTTLVQYAHWTQRGYYPDDPHKQNQDEVGIHTNFAGVETDAMFAVYDGHGAEGHSCAAFAKAKLPKAIAKQLRKKRAQKYQAVLQQQSQDPTKTKKRGWDPDKWPMLTKDEYEQCCHKAFWECNQSMHDDPKVLDKMSGTTAVSVCFHDNFVSVCNVGDSRVVLGHRVVEPRDGYGSSLRSSSSSMAEEEEKNEIGDELVAEQTIGSIGFSQYINRPGRLLAIPLTRDQTPYRRDERERVKKSGAVIMSIDQMQGKEEIHENWGDMVLGEAVDTIGDAPRVWAKGKEYPGCAFTRSLGDAFSDPIGVTGEPEILTTTLTDNDEFLVIASDGIFEFLPNQLVMDICAASETPLEACDKLVKEAYQQWLVHEKRTDDITIIVCFLRNLQAASKERCQGTTEELIETALDGSIYGTQSLCVSQASGLEKAVSPQKDIPEVNGNEAMCSVEVATRPQSATVKTEFDVTPSSPAPEPMEMDLDLDTLDVKLDRVLAVANSGKPTQSNPQEDLHPRDTIQI